MEELTYKLNTIMLLRKAVSQSYNAISDIDKYVDCISVVDEIEETLIININSIYENSSNSLKKCKV